MKIEVKYKTKETVCMFTINETDSEIEITPPEFLTVTECESMLSVAKECIAKKKDIVFNTSPINKIDTAAIQILVILSNNLKSNQLALKWKGESAALKEGMDLTGLSFIYTN